MELEPAQSGILINAACPSLTATDAVRGLTHTGFNGREAQTPERANESLLLLVTVRPKRPRPMANSSGVEPCCRFGG